MNNFKVLENLNQNSSLIIIDESTIALDDRYFAYYRGKYDFKKSFKEANILSNKETFELEVEYLGWSKNDSPFPISH